MFATRRALSQSVIRSLKNYSTVSIAEKEIPVIKDQSNNAHFTLFGKPRQIVPLMEITRKIGGSVAETIYQLVFEKQYSRDSLIRGANQGASVIADCFINRNWDKLSTLATADLSERLQEIRNSVDESEIVFLRLSPDDFVHSFLYSTVIAGKKMFKLSSSGNIGIYFTVVSFVRLRNDVPQQITLTEALGKYKTNVVAINITFARTLNPIGVWKATAFNVFHPDL